MKQRREETPEQKAFRLLAEIELAVAKSKRRGWELEKALKELEKGIRNGSFK